MDKDVEAPPLSRKLHIADIEDNVAHRIEANRAEIANIVAMLDLVALEGLVLDYQLRRGSSRGASRRRPRKPAWCRWSPSRRPSTFPSRSNSGPHR
jgi:hypothetical protein